MKSIVRFLVPLHYTFHGMRVTCLPVNHVLCWLFWAFIYYDASHSMPMEASNFPTGYSLKHRGSPGSLEYPS